MRLRKLLPSSRKQKAARTARLQRMPETQRMGQPGAAKTSKEIRSNRNFTAWLLRSGRSLAREGRIRRKEPYQTMRKHKEHRAIFGQVPWKRWS